MIRGARQVGKSTLVRRFAQRHSLVLGTIDLERHRTLDAAFATLDPGVILPEIDGLLGRKLTASDSLLFLDEIQGAPHALPALRYLKEALPELPIVAAGSLLEFVLADHAFSMPVGRIEYFHLGPMSFEEYLLAHQESDLLEALQEARPGTPTPMTVHTRLLHRQREYILVGGMPEAVSIHCETGDFARVAAVHRSIIDTYRDDFGKYASRSNLVRLQRVFDAVPRIVGQKVQYSRVVPDERPREVRQAVELLSRARVIAPVFHSHASGLPLQAEIDPQTFKLLFLDIGLMNRVNGLELRDIRGMDERTLINEGPIAEQFIGQHLLYQAGGVESPRLCYWLRHRKSANAEVDYVISRGRLIVPVEVKAGRSGSLKSLLQFVHEKRVDLAVRFDLNPSSVQAVRHSLRQAQDSIDVHYRLLSLPLYMVGQLSRILDLYRP